MVKLSLTELFSNITAGIISKKSEHIGKKLTTEKSTIDTMSFSLESKQQAHFYYQFYSSIKLYSYANRYTKNNCKVRIDIYLQLRVVLSEGSSGYLLFLSMKYPGQSEYGFLYIVQSEHYIF
jgi:hypothetical protein